MSFPEATIPSHQRDAAIDWWNCESRELLRATLLVELGDFDEAQEYISNLETLSPADCPTDGLFKSRRGFLAGLRTLLGAVSYHRLNDPTAPTGYPAIPTGFPTIPSTLPSVALANSGGTGLRGGVRTDSLSHKSGSNPGCVNIPAAGAGIPQASSIPVRPGFNVPK